jgi:hypothetical protein
MNVHRVTVVRRIEINAVIRIDLAPIHDQFGSMGGI